MVKNYIPDKGDVVWINFNPQTGREQASRRPAVVISSKKYNEKTGLFLVCPITSVRKKYPFEVPMSLKGKEGAVLVDQVKSFDWKMRKIEFIEKMKWEVFKLVQKKLILFINQ